MTKLILVVEDDLDISANIKIFLESEGFEVQTAFHGAAALEFLNCAARKPDLITLDLMMPVMDGWAFRKKQRETAELQEIPVVVVSAALNHVHSMDVHAFIKKPVDLDLFLTAIHSALSTESPHQGHQ